MLMKLSPARRVFLLIALFFAIVALTNSQVTISSSNHQHTFLFHLPNNFLAVLLAVAALLFLLALELADRVTMKRDLEIAREIQRWLVPESPPEIPGVEIAFVSRPANTVGGDYYDAFLRASPSSKPNSKRLLLVVADVAGKSVPAALLMATFQASLRTLAEANISLRAGRRVEPLCMRPQPRRPPVYNRIYCRTRTGDRRTFLRPRGAQRALHSPRRRDPGTAGDRRSAAGN